MGQPRRRWGWHQLEPAWAERLVAASGVGRGDLVLDVGAGTGSITAPLVAAGARVVAIERHPGRRVELRRTFADGVTVVGADAADLRLPRRPFHVVANPPFGVSADLLRRLVHPGSRLLSAHLILQAQVAQRWASPAAPGAARWQRSFHAEVAMAVPRRAFDPPPKVSCSVLVLRRR